MKGTIKSEVCAVTWDWAPSEVRVQMLGDELGDDQREKYEERWKKVFPQRVRLCLSCGHEVTQDLKEYRGPHDLKLSEFPAKVECPWCDREPVEIEEEQEA